MFGDMSTVRMVNVWGHVHCVSVRMVNVWTHTHTDTTDELLFTGYKYILHTHTHTHTHIHTDTTDALLFTGPKGMIQTHTHRNRSCIVLKGFIDRKSTRLN